PDPFAGLRGAFGARLYRTGDLARHLSDGTVEFLGRADTQVKVRGFRIELGEIEAVLASHPGVREAAVLARAGRPGDRRLVGYVVPAGGPLAGEALRGFLQERLPEYMVPWVVVSLRAMPLTPNGKVDRRALPAPESAGAEDYQAPKTPVEELIAGIWSQVL